MLLLTQELVYALTGLSCSLLPLQRVFPPAAVGADKDGPIELEVVKKDRQICLSFFFKILLEHFDYKAFLMFCLVPVCVVRSKSTADFVRLQVPNFFCWV
jgi:hypothetical protein